LQYKRIKKAEPNVPITPDKRIFLKQVLDTVIEKMKWDEDDDPEDMDDDDFTAFESIRKVRRYPRPPIPFLSN